MSRSAPAALALVLATVLGVPALLAGAEQDVSVTKKREDDRSIVWELYNAGDRTIVARVEARKVCSGQTNNRKPQVRTVHVEPRKSTRLGRSSAESSCERQYRVLEARYVP